jgi:predicted RNase H-like HicB family nuclease
MRILLDREVDGRWIAEVPEVNVLLYGATEQEATALAESAARELVADRIERGKQDS